jgi:hypothetical protein
MTCCARFPIPVYKINRRHRSFTQWNCPCPCQITATDCQIYQPLYQLYGLTDEEGSYHPHQVIRPYCKPRFIPPPLASVRSSAGTNPP